MNQTYLQTEPSLDYPPWLGVSKTLACGLLDVNGKNQQVRRGLLRTGIDQHIS